MKRLFIYGTLRRGVYNNDIYLRGHKTFQRYAYVRGTLYTIEKADYPALLLKGKTRILGEIHEVSDEVFKEIEKLEDFIAEGHEDNEYDRVLCDALDENNRVIERLPVYVFNMKNKDNRKRLGEVIECGDFVRYLHETREDLDYE